MLSFGAPTWQASLLSTAQASSGKASKNSTKGRAASQILPRLYLTDYFTARSEDNLKRLGITHVVSVIEHVPELPESLPELRRIHVPVLDRPEADILGHLDATTAFIQDALAENETNKVMVRPRAFIRRMRLAQSCATRSQVHCFQGISRSAAVVSAYIMATMYMGASEAVAFVKAKRGIINPNPGFLRQLHSYAAHLPPRPAKEARHSLGFKMGKIRRLVDWDGAASGSALEKSTAKVAVAET
ncbi:hypothetical protein EWM64_g7219 [Hericium alpestre]|uniref:protein-tyrosine-phosphatase n=1 Tax=Hericium alpestre TaxID=135208 RepID=A0A4Y9ZQC3_9AGAM|nr:hypothetical protein EWM64_g7219 [Hericium alpestre]